MSDPRENTGTPRRTPAQTLDRAAVVDQNFLEFLDGWPAGVPTRARTGLLPGSMLTGADFLALLHSQMVSRHLDLAARAMRARDEGFYTIGSAGHEGNALLGRLTRATDPAFLHYRSGAFMVERARQVDGTDVIRDTLLSLAASREDPIAGGRHKVWGSAPLWVLPQTSTIASHLPKAVGMAVGLGRCARLGQAPPVPRDSLVVCSFGDASANHSTATGAINNAAWSAFQGIPVPLLLVCEDNGLGISVRTPRGWIAAAYADRPGLRYFAADGTDLLAAHETCRVAVDYCRQRRGPVFLHLKVERLMGHAGSDVETAYRSLEEVTAGEARDPLLRSARTALELGLTTAPELRQRYQSIRAEVNRAAADAGLRPRLGTAAEVTAPLAPLHPDEVRREALRADYEAARVRAFGGEDKLPENGPPRHMAVQINRALFDLMAKYPQSLVFGEDVARKGGVYHVTPGLAERFGNARVFDTPLDEQSILGMAQGCGFAGLLPVPEIQYLAYLHNAADQIRGEACSTQFFSQGQFRNPMVVRIAGLAYQKGFGGHFHNDNSIAALRDIPGLLIACPSRGDDAAGLLRTCAALAMVDGRVVVFLEPIARYMTRDLHEDGDGGWVFPYPPTGTAVDLGEPRIYAPEARDMLVVTYGNGVYLSLRAARRLRETDGIHARVLDLRWLAPLPHEAVAREAAGCASVLVVDEGRRSGGVAEPVLAGLVESGLGGRPVARVTGEDTYIPLGPAADTVLPTEQGILSAMRALSSRAGSASARLC